MNDRHAGREPVCAGLGDKPGDENRLSLDHVNGNVAGPLQDALEPLSNCFLELRRHALGCVEGSERGDADLPLIVDAVLGG